MSAKGRKWDTRTILYVLIIILIVAAVIYVVTLPPDNSPPVLSVQTVLANNDFYLNKTITVEGIYYVEGNDEYLAPPTNDANPTPTLNDLLPLNTKNLGNTTTLIVKSKYHVTGRLETVTAPGGIISGIVLVVTSVDPR
jgi:ABC-type antimicrobial peptide transport system permease subunit